MAHSFAYPNFLCLVSTHSPHIVGATELWLHDNIHDSEITPTGFTVFRTDWQQNWLATWKRRRRCVIFAVWPSIFSSPQPAWYRIRIRQASWDAGKIRNSWFFACQQLFHYRLFKLFFLTILNSSVNLMTWIPLWLLLEVLLQPFSSASSHLRHKRNISASLKSCVTYFTCYVVLRG